MYVTLSAFCEQDMYTSTNARGFIKQKVDKGLGLITATRRGSTAKAMRGRASTRRRSLSPARASAAAETAAEDAAAAEAAAEVAPEAGAWDLDGA